MKPTTVFHAMIGAEFSMQLIVSIRTNKNSGIVEDKDDLAQKWQKRNRQLAKFRKFIFRTLNEKEVQK